MSTNNPTLYENFQRVRDWSENKFAYKSDIPADLSAYVTKVELSDMSYATQTYVSDAIAAIPGVDLSAYATKTYVAEYVAAYAPEPDLSAYVTKVELSNAGYLTAVPSEYITEAELSACGYLTSIPSEYVTDAELSAMGYLTEIPAEYITDAELSACGYITYIPSEYVTDAELSAKGYLTAVPNNYPTYAAISNMSYVSQTALSGMGYLTSIPSEYITQDELSANAYATIEDLGKDIVPTKTVTYSLGNVSYNYDTVYTKKIKSTSYNLGIWANGLQYLFLQENVVHPGNEDVILGKFKEANCETAYASYIYIDKVNIDDIYATKTYVADYVNTYASQPDLSAYVTKTELSNAGYLTAVPSEYITDTELSSCGYATQTYVSDAIAAIPGVDLSAYVTKTELSNAGYLTAVPSEYITQAELSANGYISSIPSEYVTDAELSAKGYLTAVPNDYPTYAAISNMSYVSQTALSGMGYLTSIPSEYVTDAELSAKGYLTAVPDTYATKTYVADYVNTYAPQPDLSAYVTKTELSNAGYISSIPSEYVTEAELSAKGYLTAVPNNYPTYAAISAMSYVSQTALSSNSYVTQTALSGMGYITGGDFPVVDENLIPKTDNTYSLGSNDKFYSAAYLKSVKLGPLGMYSFSNYIDANTNNNSLSVSIGVLNNTATKSNTLVVDFDGIHCSDGKNLGTSSSKFGYAYINNIIMNGIDLLTKINNMFSYDSTTGTLTITTM